MGHTIERFDGAGKAQDLVQEVNLLGDRQEVLVGMEVKKRDMKKEAPKKYQEKMFEEFKELEEQKKLWNLCKRSICSAKTVRIEGDEALE